MSDKFQSVARFGKRVLSRTCDKLKLVGHRSRNSGITFQVVFGGYFCLMAETLIDAGVGDQG